MSKSIANRVVTLWHYSFKRVVENPLIILHCELGAGLLVVDVVVAGLLADFPFAVGGVSGEGVVRYEASEDS